MSKTESEHTERPLRKHGDRKGHQEAEAWLVLARGRRAGSGLLADFAASPLCPRLGRDCLDTAPCLELTRTHAFEPVGAEPVL